MTAPPIDTPTRRAPDSATAFLTIYVLLLRAQRRRARIVGLAGLTLMPIVIALLVSRVDTDPGDGTSALAAVGLGIVIPVASLLTASSVLGDLIEDRSLVYVVRTPISRFVVAAAAWACAVTVVAPATLLGPVVAGIIVGEPGLVAGLFSAGLVGTFAYCGVFMVLGLVARRALVWGLVYILIWEQFAARAGDGLARLAILSYIRSLVTDRTGVELRLADRSVMISALLGPVVAVVCIVMARRRLQRLEID